MLISCPKSSYKIKPQGKPELAHQAWFVTAQNDGRELQAIQTRPKTPLVLDFHYSKGMINFGVEFPFSKYHCPSAVSCKYMYDIHSKT